MPNSANKSNGGKSNAGQGAPRRQVSNDSGSKPNPERSDLKHGGHEKNHKGDTGRSSNQGRKSSSGGEIND